MRFTDGPPRAREGVFVPRDRASHQGIFFLSPLAVCTLCAVRRLYVLPHRAPALVAVVGDKQGASGALSAVLELSQPSGSGSHPWLPLGLELSPLLSAVRAKSPGSGTAVGINLDRPGVCLAR
jgi:hypothetical protein